MVSSKRSTLKSLPTEKGKTLFRRARITVLNSFSKASNVGKFYLLPKSHKNLSKFPGHPVILNCGIVKGKVFDGRTHTCTYQEV